MKIRQLLNRLILFIVSVILVGLLIPFNFNSQVGVAGAAESKIPPPRLSSQATQPIIADHTTTDLSKIPDYWLEEAKKLAIHYAHTSHGSQINSGLEKLEQVDPKYSFHRFTAGSTPPTSLPCASGELCMYDGNPPETYITPEDYWSTSGGRDRTRAVVDTSLFDFSMWSWCGQASYYSDTQIQDYLDRMAQFETDYPNMRYILMTGHTDGGSTSLEHHNNMIRQYAIDNNMVLFDFADIETYDPLGGGPYVNNSEGTCTWCADFCDNHPEFCTDLPSSCAHSSSLEDSTLFCKLKGNAFWWLLARLAGWDGNSGGVDNTAPHIPANPNPADGAANVFFKNNLTWQGGDPDGDPVTYTVAFGPVNPPPVTATVTTPLYAPTMATNTTYYWQITSTDGISSSVGPTWQFTTSAETTLKLHLPIILKNSAGSSPTGHAPEVAGCEVFPADNIWNTAIDTLPVDANSTAYVNTIGADANLHADFGSGDWPPGSGFPIGIPYTDVPGTQAKVNVNFTYASESDPGPYPIPPNPPIEGDPNGSGDRHILIVDRDNCTLYELYAAHLEPDGWYAGSGAIFDLSSHTLRPDGWTSADAAGLPILPGLARYDEVAVGEIRHALRFTAPQTRRDYVWPARHYASDLTGAQYPPMGQRFRLKADFDISGYSPQARVILQALKTYGMILADNGSSWYISGAPDDNWDNDVLHELHQIAGANFEAVDVSSLMIDPDSGQVQP